MGLKMTVESCKGLTIVGDRIRKINQGQNRKQLSVLLGEHGRSYTARIEILV